MESNCHAVQPRYHLAQRARPGLQKPRVTMRNPPITVLLLAAAISSCVSTHAPAPSPASDTDAVRQFIARVATDITARGPAAWRDFFDDSPNFFMVSDGKLVFPSGAAAREGIQGLTQVITSIQLRWGTDLLVQPLAPGVAMVAMPYHERRVDTAGRRIEEDGYFTGVAEYEHGSWRFRNAHWSGRTGLPHRGGYLERRSKSRRHSPCRETCRVPPGRFRRVRAVLAESRHVRRDIAEGGT